MSKYLVSTLLVFAFATAACGDEKASCDKVVEHTLKIVPAELVAQMGDKDSMLERCKETSEEQRACVLKAKSAADLMKCK